MAGLPRAQAGSGRPRAAATRCSVCGSATPSCSAPVAAAAKSSAGQPAATCNATVLAEGLPRGRAQGSKREGKSSLAKKQQQVQPGFMSCMCYRKSAAFKCGKHTVAGLQADIYPAMME